MNKKMIIKNVPEEQIKNEIKEIINRQEQSIEIKINPESKKKFMEKIDESLNRLEEIAGPIVGCCSPSILKDLLETNGIINYRHAAEIPETVTFIKDLKATVCVRIVPYLYVLVDQNITKNGGLNK
jgi:ADP-heptose:LPS heptosyltransferase